LFGLLLFFGLLQRYLTDTGNLTRVVGVMMAVALFEGLYGLIQALIPTLPVLWADIPSGLGNARGTFINKNHFAGFVEMTWPLGLGVILGLTHRWQKNMEGGYSKKNLKNLLSSDQIGFLLFFTIALLFTILSLLFSKSRAGITGAFIGFAAFIFLVYLGREKFSAPAWVFMSSGFCFILFYGDVIGFEELIGRFLATDDETGSRVDIWRNTIAIIKDHPLGIGLRNYETVLPIYNATSPLGIKFAHAHNDYLELLTETGWPGFIALVGGFFIFLGNSFRRIRKFGAKTDPIRFYIGIGACSGLISIVFHSFFDFNLQIPANLLYFVVLLSLVYNCVWRKF
jgi:O-antigen ligase